LFGSNIFPFELSKPIKNSTLAARKNRDEETNTHSIAFSPTFPHVSRCNSFPLAFAYTLSNTHSHTTCNTQRRNAGMTKSSNATSQLRPHRRNAGIVWYFMCTCAYISAINLVNLETRMRFHSPFLSLSLSLFCARAL